LSELNGSNGFRIDGLAVEDETGLAVAFPGDFNGDGREDLQVSAMRSDIAGMTSGSTYVIHGRSTAEPFEALLNLSDIAAGDELRIDGRELDYSGLAASRAGDLNDDGIADLLIGALAADSGGGVYVIFGDDRLLIDDFE